MFAGVRMEIKGARGLNEKIKCTADAESVGRQNGY